MQVLFNSIDGQTNQEHSVCVFSHYDPNGVVEPYVRYYLRELKRCNFAVVFVTTSPSLDDESLAALRELTVSCILRENIGYDFGSYKTGIDHTFLRIPKVKQLLLTNDSVFGPIYPLDKVLATAQEHDVFGMTDSFDFHYHLQSYFLLYNKKTLHSHAFKAFWGSVESIDAGQPGFKQKIILQYEVGGSQFFREQGFSLKAAFPYRQLMVSEFSDYLQVLEHVEEEPRSSVKPLHIKFNSTHSYWKKLIQQGYPFLKRELLLVNPTNTDISTWPATVAKHSNYDPTLIVSALRNFSGSDDFFFLTNPTETSQSMNSDSTLTLSINPAFFAWQQEYDVPSLRTFKFDEQRYLNHYPDVKVAVEQGKIENGKKHFLLFGYSEGRLLGLTRFDNSNAASARL
ncbi:rhamnan synthesis F family protein [Hydrogenophaga sp. PAMC20947]|uniref:rhamnan synthesis F family protein n=1 Tax=Hydrogenophaga sp. PAMC20947 TaxID=2565558 RepID=UPI00109D88E2|nr:rhamnan synthesis F family protein [Hydrogenophaga sp. PAMC20947]QCB46344.1 hypothetical protein E5678_10105 [Hydrogenophaga sp. PAMC20947]